MSFYGSMNRCIPCISLVSLSQQENGHRRAAEWDSIKRISYQICHNKVIASTALNLPEQLQWAYMLFNTVPCPTVDDRLC